jgi:hypothetical protein
MRASAARGSPWLPVTSTTTLSRGIRWNASGPRNGGSPEHAKFAGDSITRSIARPATMT